METAGITIERDYRGTPIFAHIDLRKYGNDLTSFFKEKGVEVESLKFTQKTKHSLTQAKRGEITKVDMDNFWDNSKGIFDCEDSNPGLDEAIGDVKNNRVYKAKNAKDLISQCLK
jgi:hypothetical protein